MSTSEKICLNWGHFQKNLNASFGSLKQNKEFSDVTLVCGQGKQVEAHKVILAASSPFFQNILKTNIHPHPMIYMGGVKEEELVHIIDFMYLGEAMIPQEDMDKFLALGKELDIKGLASDVEDTTVIEETKSYVVEEERTQIATDEGKGEKGEVVIMNTTPAIVDDTNTVYIDNKIKNPLDTD